MADDVINEQMQVALCTAMAYDTTLPTRLSLLHNSFLSFILCLCYISQRFLLVLNQIQIKLHSKDYI